MDFVSVNESSAAELNNATTEIFFDISQKHLRFQEHLMERVCNKETTDLRKNVFDVRRCHLEFYRTILNGINSAYEVSVAAKLTGFKELLDDLKFAPLQVFLNEQNILSIYQWQEKLGAAALKNAQTAVPEGAFDKLNRARSQLVTEFQTQRGYVADLFRDTELVHNNKFTFAFLMNQANLVCAVIESVGYALIISPLAEQPDTYGSCIEEEFVLLNSMALGTASASSSLQCHKKMTDIHLLSRMVTISSQLFEEFIKNPVESLDKTKKAYYKQLKMEGISSLISFDKQANIFHDVLLHNVVEFTDVTHNAIRELEVILDMSPAYLDETKLFASVGKQNMTKINWAVIRMQAAGARYAELNKLLEQKKTYFENKNVVEAVLEPVKTAAQVAVDLLELDKPVPAKGTEPVHIEMKVFKGAQVSSEAANLDDSLATAIESEDLDSSTVTALELNESVMTALEDEDLDSSIATALELNESVMTALEDEDLDSSIATALELNESVMTALEDEDLDSSIATALELNECVMTALEDEDLDSSIATALELNESVMTALEDEDLDSSIATALELSESVMTALEDEDLDSSNATALELSESVMTAIESEDLDSSTATALDDPSDILDESTETAIEDDLNESTMTAMEQEDLDSSTTTALELNESVMTAIEDEDLNSSTATALEELNESVMTAIESEEASNFLNDSTATAIEEDLNESTMTAIESEEIKNNILNDSTATAIEQEEMNDNVGINASPLTKRTTVSTNLPTSTQEPIAKPEIATINPDGEISRMDQIVVILFLAYIALLILHFTVKN